MPYTTEQLQAVSTLFAMERLMGVSERACMEDSVDTLRNMERQNVVRIDEYSGEIIEGEPFVVEHVYFRAIPTPRRHNWWSHSRQRVVERHYYADEDNAIAAGCRRCDCCEEWVHPNQQEDGEGISVPNGDWFCSYDCAGDSGWSTCQRCGEWVHTDDEVYIENVGSFCDEWCAERAGYFRCDHCDEWTSEYDSHTVMVDGDTESWCEWCYDNHSVYCDRCDEHVHEDEISYDEDSGEYVCDSCRRDEDFDDCCSSGSCSTARINSYNYCPPIKLFGTSPFRMGVELETDSGSNRMAYAGALDSIEGFNEHFWMTEDGSLSNGVEITSHPMDLAYHWKLYVGGIYGAISNAASKYGFVSHNSGNCGLHVSMSRDALGKSVIVQDAAILKMMRLCQRFENQLLVFSRRRRADLERWATFKTYGDYSEKSTKVDVKTDDRKYGLFDKARAFKENETTKYRAVNICHANHVEIRIFRGTLKWSTYFATLAFVEGLAKVSKVKPLEWVEGVSWYDFINEVVDAVSVDGPREMLREYLDEKGLC